MTTIIYRFKRWPKRTILVAVTFAMIGMTQLVLLTSLVLGVAPWTDALAEKFWLTVSDLVMLLACVIFVALSLRLGGTRREYLRLDDEGLTYGNLFGAHRWPWHDLSAFALRRQFAANTYVTFALPGKTGWTVNQCPWERTTRGPKAMIEDIYDAPIDVIAAKLNEYRDRARGDRRSST